MLEIEYYRKKELDYCVSLQKIKAMKIYTKTGDAGETSLFGGARLPKNHIRIESYGTLDELNSYIGLVSDSTDNQAIKLVLKEIQDRLFTIGSHLASDPSKDMIVPDLKLTDIETLETEMDNMDLMLEPLRHFILPGGHVSVSYCHVARCVCRRCERLVVALAQNEKVDAMIVQYLNRLSDYLFVLARFMAYSLGIVENKWTPRKS